MRQNTAVFFKTQSFNDVRAKIDLSKKTLAVFDIDDTLIVTAGYNPAQQPQRKCGYGSDIWFTQVYEQMNKHHPDYPKLYLMLMAEYLRIQQNAQHVTTEECVLEVLDFLHQNNIRTLGLSARSAKLAPATARCYENTGVRFSAHALEEAVVIPSTDSHVDDTVFLHGTVHCSGRPKEVCLDAFRKLPQGAAVFEGVEQVLFIDDKEKYCQALFAYLQKEAFLPVVLHYTRVADLFEKASAAEVAEDKARLEMAPAVLAPV